MCDPLASVFRMTRRTFGPTISIPPRQDVLIEGMNSKGHIVVDSNHTFGSGRARYTSEHLLRILLLAEIIKDDKDLAAAMELAIDTVLPNAFAKQFRSALREGGYVPSKSTTSRTRLLLDVAYMMTLRDVNLAHGLCNENYLPARYIMADASTQGGVDWQLCHIIFISSEDIVPLFDAQTRLIQIRETLREQVGSTPM